MASNAFGNRLLLIDDDVAIGRFFEKVAEGMKFEVVTTTDPTIFLKKARSWLPTVVILDLQMPGVDGVELLRDLAADRCSAKIILASGAGPKVLESVRGLAEARGLNVAGILEKPVGVAMLRQLLAAFISVSVSASELAEAIASDHLLLEYQPKLDIRRDQFVGVEALVRWKHPQHGIIQPDRFIMLAEQSDLIHRLTDWVMLAAAKQSAMWNRENVLLDVSVNISARDVEERALPERLDRCCRDAGISPESIILELTETTQCVK